MFVIGGSVKLYYGDELYLELLKLLFLDSGTRLFIVDPGLSDSSNFRGIHLDFTYTTI